MPALRRFVRCLSFLALLAAAPDVALAQAPAGATGNEGAAAAAESARDLFLRGQAAYAQGDYRLSVELWSRAYVLDARPQLQYNLAQAYGRLGRVEDERAALERFVAETSPGDPLLAPSRARLAMLEQRIAQTGLVLEVEGYEGAVVRIDGEERGLLPGRLAAYFAERRLWQLRAREGVHAAYPPAGSWASRG